MLSECSYRSEDYRKLDFGEQQTFDSLCFLEPKITEEALKRQQKQSLRIHHAAMYSGSKEL